jgi:hypothetical protein
MKHLNFTYVAVECICNLGSAVCNFHTDVAAQVVRV